MTTLSVVGKLLNDREENEVEVALLSEGVLSLASFEITVDPKPPRIVRNIVPQLLLTQLD